MCGLFCCWTFTWTNFLEEIWSHLHGATGYNVSVDWCDSFESSSSLRCLLCVYFFCQKISNMSTWPLIISFSRFNITLLHLSLIFFNVLVRPKFTTRKMKSFMVVKAGNSVRITINFEVTLQLFFNDFSVFNRRRKNIQCSHPKYWSCSWCSFFFFKGLPSARYHVAEGQRAGDKTSYNQ